MNNKEFNLSEKRRLLNDQTNHYEPIIAYEEKDIREFIKRLKEEIRRAILVSDDDEIIDVSKIIYKLAGDKLI